VQLHGTPRSGRITGALDSLRRFHWQLLKATEEINGDAITYKRCSFTFNRLGEQGKELIHLTVIS
jgi:hypothetical protein